MVLPNPFTTATQIIASYDYYDYAEGTGVKVFDAYGSKETTNTTYGMGANIGRGNPTSASSGTLYFNLTQFNTPKEVKGTGRIEGSFAMSSAQGAVSGTGYLTFTLEHWDGTTATTIGTVTTETISIGSDTNIQKDIAMDYTLTTKHFAQGDILRMKVVFTHAGANTWLVLAFDPLNKDVSIGTPVHPEWVISAATHPTTLNFNIPFDLQQ